MTQVAKSAFEVDIFVVFKSENESALITLTPIYEYLRVNGAVIEGEHIRIGDWPVRFLPASNELLKEAMAEAVDVIVGGLATRVFSAEHLAAIALQTGRAKDKSRLLQFVESGVMNRERFAQIVLRHELDTKWELFKSQFLGQK
jgi:hypothetical protein